MPSSVLVGKTRGKKKALIDKASVVAFSTWLLPLLAQKIFRVKGASLLGDDWYLDG